MTLVEVTDKKTAAQFLEVPKLLYRSDPNWICPLDVEIEGIFDPRNNSCFLHGEAKRWILTDGANNLIGRIAAFIDRNKVNLFGYPAGGAGFFECINNQEAANLLFNTAVFWLSDKGMKAMQAPINFGENFVYWGLLTEGFMQQGYGMPYNFPYYKSLFETYGFKNFFEQYSYHIDLSKPFPERMLKFAEYIETRPNFSFEHFSYEKAEKFIDDLVTTYNTIWSSYHDGYSPLKHNDLRKMMEDAKPVIDEKLIWFAYDKGNPVALVINYPDVNQVLKKLKNGRLSLINKLKFLYYKNSKVITRSRSLVAGVLPEYQNSGIIMALFYQYIKEIWKRPHHTQIELSWVGDYNPKMIAIYEKIGGYKVKTHITYMYLFDKKIKFQRFNNEFEGKLY
ncbi:MAG: hypothetical protein JXJ22_16530 [Bacteroidales bacterium]|nr:hypothetical protein [Bacteroidales bacterium]